MTDLEIIKRLVDSGYPLTLIASQSGVPYQRIYRELHGKYPLNAEDSAKLRAFAFIQPAFTKGHSA